MIATCFYPIEVEAENTVIVIDPGHSGKNHGAEWDGLMEKDLTMKVANAMLETLNEFEGVTVYLTHETDRDMSLLERVQYADQVDADYFFCLHFNMSADHDLFYGSEFWIPSRGENYVKGYQYSSILAETFQEKGLFIRGIKTRLNSDGEDYYGIIRHCEEYSIPSVLIEHCHLDHVKDEPYYNTEEALYEFGEQDALAVAKFLGLSSSSLGLDYSGYQLSNVAIPDGVVAPDETPADVMSVSIDEINQENGTLTATLIAEDFDSYVNYYCYSTDGGETFSDLELYESGGSTFTIPLPIDQNIDFVVRSYNSFDKAADTTAMALGVINTGQTGLDNAETEELTRSVETEVGDNDTDQIETEYTSVETESFETSDSADYLSDSTSYINGDLTIAPLEEMEENTEESEVVQAAAKAQEKDGFSFSEKMIIIFFLLMISIGSVVFSALVTFQVTKKNHKKDRKDKKDTKDTKDQGEHPSISNPIEENTNSKRNSDHVVKRNTKKSAQPKRKKTKQIIMSLVKKKPDRKKGKTTKSNVTEKYDDMSSKKKRFNNSPAFFDLKAQENESNHGDQNLPEDIIR